MSQWIQKVELMGGQMTRKVLVVAAHPDDEVLGCGGTIARHAAEGDSVHILIVGEGETSRQTNRDSAGEVELVEGLAKAAERAGRILGANEVEIIGLPDNRMDSLDRLDLIKMIEMRVVKHKPEIVYVHHAGDVNIDHRRLHEAVITACRPMPGKSVRQILSFEVASSTEWQTAGSAPSFNPNCFVDISEKWDLKKQALETYAAEMRPWPHARSMEALEHLARWRGAQVGVEAAEAFCLLRWLR